MKMLLMDTHQIPTSLKIGPHLVKLSLNYRSKKNLGVFLAKKLEIRLRPKLPPTVLLDTLIHEIKHAKEYLLNENQLPNEEELRVSIQATNEAQFVLENPKFLLWQLSLCQQITGAHEIINSHSGNTWKHTPRGEQLSLGIDGPEKT
jgi:hypothetical protein